MPIAFSALFNLKQARPAPPFPSYVFRCTTFNGIGSNCSYNGFKGENYIKF